MILHILSKSPIEYNLELFYLYFGDKDSILLYQDGVLLSLNKNFINKILINKKNIKLYIIDEDVKARGIIKLISNIFMLINYNKFVKLTENHKNILFW